MAVNIVAFRKKILFLIEIFRTVKILCSSLTLLQCPGFIYAEWSTSHTPALRDGSVNKGSAAPLPVDLWARRGEL